MKKCKWINLDGRKCRLPGKYNGYCKRHEIEDYVYNRDGIKNNEEGMEGCGHIKYQRIVPYNIEWIANNSDKTFVGKYGIKYEYVKNNVSSVTMRVVGSTEDTVLFWRDKESRGNRDGYLLNSLKVNTKEYCENIAVCIVEKEFYCESCFESVYGCRIKSLEQSSMEEIINCLNLISCDDS